MRIPRRWAAAGAAILLGALTVAERAPAAPRVVAISAHRFAYQPDLVTVRRGQPVTLELRSTDRLHGFVIPALGIRSDISPDGTARVTFTPQQAGRFLFHCDIFCGDDHEEMVGHLVVVG